VSQAMMHMGLLSNYQIIDREGVFKVKVAYDINDEHLFVNDEYPRYIIPLKVIRAEDLPILVNILKKYDQVPYGTIKHYFVTAALFLNDGVDPKDLPVKGEEVLVTFEYVDERLMATHISLIPREELDYVNIEAMDTMYNLIKKLSDE